MHPNAKQRLANLETLYRFRAENAHHVRGGWVSEYDLKNAHGDVRVALDVLTETGQVKRDGMNYQITGAGVVAFETANSTS